MDNTVLAIEAAASLKSGVRAAKKEIGEVTITDVFIDETAAKSIGKAAGRYITLEGEPHAAGMSALLEKAISQVLPKSGKLFAAGLGNPDITQDSLGALCVRKLRAGKGARFDVFALETDVAARTGLETSRLVRAAAREIPADCVMIFDALACSDPRRIGKTVQISSAGIVPGSGAGACRGELSRKTLKVPVAAVGVPTMSALSTVTKNPSDSAFLITTSDIDALVEQWSEVIAGAMDAL